MGPGDEFVDTARRVTPQNVLAVYDFTDTGIRVHRHRYTSSQTPVYEFTTPVYEFTDTGIRVHDTGIRVHRHRYTSSTTPVYEFTDTGSASHLQFWVKSKISATWGVLEFPLDMES